MTINLRCEQRFGFVRILIVDDHPLFIDGLKFILNKNINDLEILEATRVEKALTLIDNHDIDLVLIDFKIPELDGIDLLKAFLERGLTVPSIMISGESNPTIVKQAMDIGACGFIPKSFGTDKFLNALHVVLQGGEFLPEEIKYQVEQLNRQDFSLYSKNKTHPKLNITPRQLEVLKLMGKGYSNKKISNIMNLSADTVKGHIHNIFLVLSVENRTSCIIRANELGLDVID